MTIAEVQFDGLVGPTHNYGGLSAGNVASETHEGEASNPRAAALEGLEKMRKVAALGVPQAVLPPHDRPSITTLRRLGFGGSDEEIIARAGQYEGGRLLRLCSSAAAMWAANAATVSPSTDTLDKKLHVTPANLNHMFHRSLEASVTERVFRAVFASEEHFVVHPPLPSSLQFSDEGAANHLRLFSSRGAVHVFAWGRESPTEMTKTTRYPARQAFEASRALARSHELSPDACLFPRQAAAGIDAGAFHTDVLAVGTGPVLLLHELAFEGRETLVSDLRTALGGELKVVQANEKELPAKVAVAAYPFNSQLLETQDGLVLLAPEDVNEHPEARSYLDRVVSEGVGVVRVETVDVRQSMRNGGGPACLRLRVRMSDAERSSVRANVFLTDTLFEALRAWVLRYYRDRLTPNDLGDVALARESMTALDELSGLLGLGAVYDFQR